MGKKKHDAHYFNKKSCLTAPKPPNKLPCVPNEIKNAVCTTPLSLPLCPPKRSLSISNLGSYHGNHAANHTSTYPSQMPMLSAIRETSSKMTAARAP